MSAIFLLLIEIDNAARDTTEIVLMFTYLILTLPKGKLPKFLRPCVKSLILKWSLFKNGMLIKQTL